MNKILNTTAKKAVALLKEKKLTVATAESCTGGLISSLITSVSGASSVFGLGICSYAAEAKINTLGVKTETIEKFGTVSELTATEMAERVKLLGSADIGLSVTGVAGPSSTEGKPVGLVYIALSNKNKTTVKKLNIENLGRDFIRSTAALEVFYLLINYLNSEEI